MDAIQEAPRELFNGSLIIKTKLNGSRFWIEASVDGGRTWRFVEVQPARVFQLYPGAKLAKGAYNAYCSEARQTGEYLDMLKARGIVARLAKGKELEP